MRRTYYAKQGEVERKWYLIDADGMVLGRMATEIARILRGKHKPQFTPHTDTGDFIVVINADKVRLTGKKIDDKIYYRHSGYPGGIKSINARALLKRFPERVVEYAVWGMLPKNSLGRKQYTKLKVYRGPSHPHKAQNPEKLEF